MGVNRFYKSAVIVFSNIDGSFFFPNLFSSLVRRTSTFWLRYSVIWSSLSLCREIQRVPLSNDWSFHSLEEAILNIDLNKRLDTVDGFNIFVCVWCYSWHQHESHDLTSLLKNMNRVFRLMKSTGRFLSGNILILHLICVFIVWNS